VSAPGVFFPDGDRTVPARGIGYRGDHSEYPKPREPSGYDDEVPVTLTKREWLAVCASLYAGMQESMISDEMGTVIEEKIVKQAGPLPGLSFGK